MRLPLPAPAVVAVATVALCACPLLAQTARPTLTPTAIIGRVVDDDACTPIAGASVTLSPTGTTALTDANGRYQFDDIAPGLYTVTAQRSAYLRDTVADIDVAAPLGYAELRLVRPANRSAASRIAGAGSATSGVAPPRDMVLEPAQPRQGSLFRLRVGSVTASADGRASLPSATFAGERLHFVRVAGGSYEALAPVPVDAADTLALVVARPGGDPAVTWVPIARANFPVERLRVAPEFGRQPDRALAERLERESERARDVGCQAHRTPRLWTEPFLRPRPGRVTSGFGRAREYNGTVTGRHTGTDYAGATGAPVYATNRGVVRLIGRFYLGGNVVYLDHGAGLVSAYLHLSRTSVAVGDTVARGQVIGRVGSTGRVTGPHLHWIVRYGRLSVDGATLLALAGAPRSDP